MKTIVLLFGLCPGFLWAQSSEGLNGKIVQTGYSITYDLSDTSVNRIQNYVESGLQNTSSFLSKPYKNSVSVYVFPDRSALDLQWQTAWQMPSFQSECWMVGSGVESRLDLLSPSIWADQACDHNPGDQLEIQRLVHHELTHILHSDYNQSPSFEDINNIDWFIEGLATYVSGQLDSVRMQRTIQFVKNTGGPSVLNRFWTGQHKYGLAGSMVRYVDTRYGRAVLTDLLQYKDVNDILHSLQTTEEVLIKNWKEDLLSE